MTDPTDRTDDDAFGQASPEEAETPQPGDPRLAEALIQLRAIAGALATGVLVYAGLGWYFTSGAMGRSYESPGLPGVLVAVLAAFAVFDLVVAPVIERSLTPGAGPQSGAGSGGASGTGGRGVEAAIAGYRRAKIIGFAFREAAAVLGLLITLFTGRAAWCYALAAATLVAMALAWPSREGLERAARGSVQPQ